jgi:hypothetical protein
MTSEHIDQWHEVVFQNECYKRQGMSFQGFFEEIMRKHDSSFVAIKPSGKEGDWKSDGFSYKTGTCYQVYAPDSSKVVDAIDKINEDFQGAQSRWNSKMKGWIFVYAIVDRVPPQIQNTIFEIRDCNKHLTIDVWGRESLWKIVKSLDINDRNILLRPFPSQQALTETRMEDIKQLIDYLLIQETQIEAPDDLQLLEIGEKITKNNLQAVYELIKNGTGVARLVAWYTGRHPTPNVDKKISALLVDQYKKLSQSSPDNQAMIFLGLVNYVQNQHHTEKATWAAVGIVSYYFQICDIFEK